MSMLLCLVIICYMITQISCEVFTTGVGLFTNRSRSENNSGCYLLEQQAGDSWWSSGFHNCTSNPPISFGLDWQLIPFRISVNSKVFCNYPAHDIEQYALINKQLNAHGKQCLTVTGSNWWIEQVVHDWTYVIRMVYNYPLGDVITSVCSTLSNSSYYTSASMMLMNCFSQPMENVRKQRRDEIQLLIRIFPYTMLLSESLHKSIQLITGRINTLSDHCVFVSGVLQDEFGQAVDVHLQFKGGIMATNSCALLIKSSCDAYNLLGNITCENDMIYYTCLQWNIHAVHLRIHGNLNGIPLDMMSNVEIALRVEALFNIDQIGCIIFEPGHTVNILKKSKQRLVSFVSGPSSADICNQVKLTMGANFYTFYKSCVKEDLVLSNENRLSSHRLEGNEPFYEIDELLYLERHAQLVHNLNKPYLSCEYNGYIQTEQCSAKLALAGTVVRKHSPYTYFNALTSHHKRSMIVA